MRAALISGTGVALAAAVLAPAALASTYPVTSAADAGPGTLRQAILDANAHPGGDTVKFNLPGAGVQTIAVTTPLPAVTETLTINGRSQPGFAGTPLVRVDNAAATKLNGLRIAADDSQVLGLELTRFAIAIRLVGDANRVQGNLIGTNAAGAAGLGNATGVRVESGADNRIGGLAGSAPNVISGNTNFGIEIAGPAAGTTVSGNRIGTNPAGTAALANGTGVRIGGGTTQNVIGGTTTAERNVISGNQQYGIRLTDPGTSQNTVLGNYIGTTATGAGALSNGVGLRADNGAAPNTIGGATAGARNVISGNASIGIHLDGSAMSANTIAGNYIGTTATGTARLANGTGVRLSNGAHDNTIGGPTPDFRNVISGSTGNGIEFINIGTKNNAVTSNYIGTNATGSAKLDNNWSNYYGVYETNGAGPDTIGAPGAGNLISGNLGGVVLSHVGDVVAANYIGTDAAGTAKLGNSFGVGMSRGTLGGTSAGARNVISGNTYEGISLGSGVTVAGNYIGTDVSGAAPLANGIGVQIYGGVGNTIGGPTASARNVISANGIGIDMENSWNYDVGYNLVQGNYIGTDATGSAAIGNGTGVRILAHEYGGDSFAAGSNTIEDNVISGSSGWAVLFDGSNESYAGDFFGNRVLGNYIGTNAAGDAALPNGGGVRFLEGPNFYSNPVGGTGPGQRNVISGNTGWGVLISADLAYDYGSYAVHHGNDVIGNYIGTKAGGGKALGNGGGGVRLETGAQETTVSSNRIAFNGGTGVVVDGAPSQAGVVASGDSILGNSMFNNTGLGIDLVNGGNHDQAAPAITSVTTNGGATVIGGTLDSTASTMFRIELFSSPSCDPSGAGEGKTFLGSTDVTTDGTGHATFSTSVAAQPSGQAVTATATNAATKDTSEFSTCFGSP